MSRGWKYVSEDYRKISTLSFDGGICALPFLLNALVIELVAISYGDRLKRAARCMLLLLAQGPGKGPTTFGLMYTTFPCISARGCFQDTHDLMVTRQQLYRCTRAPLPVWQ
jgi:hypothetical protein